MTIVTCKRLVLAGLACALLFGCATKKIPNTRVDDTESNRQVIEFVEKYRKAVEQRDVPVLLSMASKYYFDDMGTTAGDDDIDYDGLREGLARLRTDVLSARYQISYRGLSEVADNRVWVDLLYTGWFKISTPEGSQWQRRLEPHRVILSREDGKLKIISGM